MSGRTEASIEEAENGYMVRVSCDNPDGPHESKRFVAKTREEAQTIAGHALSGKIKVGKKKGKRGRDVVAQAPKAKKRSARKRSY